jgi:hypothetical protein
VTVAIFVVLDFRFIFAYIDRDENRAKTLRGLTGAGPAGT